MALNLALRGLKKSLESYKYHGPEPVETLSHICNTVVILWICRLVSLSFPELMTDLKSHLRTSTGDVVLHVLIMEHIENCCSAAPLYNASLFSLMPQ